MVEVEAVWKVNIYLANALYQLYLFDFGYVFGIDRLEQDLKIKHIFLKFLDNEKYSFFFQMGKYRFNKQFFKRRSNSCPRWLNSCLQGLVPEPTGGRWNRSQGSLQRHFFWNATTYGKRNEQNASTFAISVQAKFYGLPQDSLPLTKAFSTVRVGYFWSINVGWLDLMFCNQCCTLNPNLNG